MATPNLGALNELASPLGYTMVSGYYVDPIKDFLLNVANLKNGGSLSELEGQYPSAKDGTRATRVAEAVERSISEGRVVGIEEI
jgi:hypothetical protein